MKRKTRKLINRNLDAIYKTSKSIASEWDKKTIPLKALKTIVDKSKPSVNTESKEVNEFIKSYNKCLDSLYKSCVEIASKMNSKDIPVSQIKNGINIIKTAYA